MRRTALCLLLAILILPAPANAACPPGYYERMGQCVPYPLEYRNQDRHGHQYHHGRAYRPPNETGGGAPAQPQTGEPVAVAPPAADWGGPRARPPSVDRGGAATATVSPRPVRIWDTGYAVLPRLGGEASGYGLYSYAILPSPSQSGAKFLAEVFRSTPAVETSPISRDRLNVLYLPIQADKEPAFRQDRERPDINPDRLGADVAGTFYDYPMARAILAQVCGYPPDDMREFCLKDVMSGGPYLFSYAAPASARVPVPPPYLLADLSNVDPRAYPALLSAFRAQVKREDMTDKARIDTLRLSVLQIILQASDLIGPMRGAVEDLMKEIVHTAEAQKPSSPAASPR